MEEQTIADVAIKQAKMRTSVVGRIVYTGRVLVKRPYEDNPMPSPIDPHEISKYLAPELRRFIRPLFRLMVEGSGQMALERSVVIHSMAEDQPDAISVYDRTGRVEL